MTDHAENPVPSDDVKAKFKAALDKKKGGGDRRGGTGNVHGKVQSTHGSEAHQKQFRRKSGG